MRFSYNWVNTIQRVNNYFNLTEVESCCANPYEPQPCKSIELNSLQLTRSRSYSHALPSQRIAAQNLDNTESQRRISDDNNIIKYTITRIGETFILVAPQYRQKDSYFTCIAHSYKHS